MFDLLKDITKMTGQIIGTVAGSVIGLSTTTIAATLGLTTSVVREALNAGCTTYEEIREFSRKG